MGFFPFWAGPVLTANTTCLQNFWGFFFQGKLTQESYTVTCIESTSCKTTARMLHVYVFLWMQRKAWTWLLVQKQRRMRRELFFCTRCYHTANKHSFQEFHRRKHLVILRPFIMSTYLLYFLPPCYPSTPSSERGTQPGVISNTPTELLWLGKLP